MSAHTLDLGHLSHEAAGFFDNQFEGISLMPTRNASRLKKKKSFGVSSLLDSAISYLSQQYLSLESEGL